MQFLSVSLQEFINSNWIAELGDFQHRRFWRYCVSIVVFALSWQQYHYQSYANVDNHQLNHGNHRPFNFHSLRLIAFANCTDTFRLKITCLKSQCSCNYESIRVHEAYNTVNAHATCTVQCCSRWGRIHQKCECNTR